jgi:hypothetical protein
VFGWLRKPGSREPWKNTAGLDAESIERLLADLEAVERLSPGITERLVRYILDGEDAAVLEKLAGVQGAGKALGLACVEEYAGHMSRNRRQEFLDGLDAKDAAFYLRLARTWEAASRSQPRNLHTKFAFPDLEWLEVFLREATGFTVNMYPSPYRTTSGVSATLVEEMLEADGKPPDLLVRLVYLAELRSMTLMYAKLPGFAERSRARREIVLEALSASGADRILQVLKCMGWAGVDPAAFADRLAELAVSASKLVREKSGAFLEGRPDVAIGAVERLARTAGNDERIHAARFLWRLAGESARPFLESRLAEEKTKRVEKAIRELLPPEEDGTPPELVLPPLEEVPAIAPLSSEARAALRSCLERVEAELIKLRDAGMEVGEDWKEPGRCDADAFAIALEGLNVPDASGVPLLELPRWVHSVSKPINDFCARPDVSMIHVVRLAVTLGRIQLAGEEEDTLDYLSNMMISEHQRAHPPGLSLRELGAVFRAVGLDPRLPGATLLRGWTPHASSFGTKPETVWHYFLEHLDLLQSALAERGDYLQSERRARALEILSGFPLPPPRLIPLLWESALGPRRERLKAQRCLERAPATIPRVVAALGDGKAEVRAAAAEWIARLEEESAREALLSGVRKEKNEAARAAMMTALEKLGVPLEQFLGRDGLLAEARKGLSKGLPPALEGFPFPAMPTVHWADDGSPVDPDVLRWLLVQATKLKNPEPGALLRRYCAAFAPGDREALGEFILASWIDLDTVPISRAEAETQARAHAQLLHNASQNPASGLPQQTLEQFYASVLPVFLKQPGGSAIESKGVLAVAAACGGSGIAPRVSKYLKEWYGIRRAHSIALVQMLAWVEHPAAIQLVLAVGSRFRTKGIQEEAARQAQAIADRKGWTLEELADRTIPSAGFDEAGEMVLDYGPRRFTAKLEDDLEITLTTSEGRTLSSLPNPRAGDDEGLAKEARKLFSASKKEVKTVLKMQGERLHEAMCSQRIWRFEDWDLYLRRHPIGKHISGRLVWIRLVEGAPPITFRPLPDGTLTNAEDEPVTLAPEDPVRLAHDSNTPADTAAAWSRHLADYEVEPLFQQFGRPGFVLPEERRAETEIGDFLGHVLDALRLRGRATKLGYTRGPTEGRGMFYTYTKRFPALGLVATIEFTGANVTEVNRKVALRSLRFEYIGQEGGGARAALGDVPPVLLAETWNDLRSIAAEGPGFDPDWEKRTAP